MKSSYVIRVTRANPKNIIPSIQLAHQFVLKQLFLKQNISPSADRQPSVTTRVTYPPCSWHWDCERHHFCGVRCWTGDCAQGQGAKDGKFCQPCTLCTKYTDSVTRGCKVCEGTRSSHVIFGDDCTVVFLYS